MRIKLNENENSGVLYAIAYCEDPDIYSEEFWGWDTESDVGYELMEFGSLIQDADVFDSLEAAEDRADDVLSSIFEDEVFIVGLDPYTPHNLTGFVKKVTRDSINESKSTMDYHKDKLTKITNNIATKIINDGWYKDHDDETNLYNEVVDFVQDILHSDNQDNYISNDDYEFIKDETDVAGIRNKNAYGGGKYEFDIDFCNNVANKVLELSRVKNESKSIKEDLPSLDELIKSNGHKLTRYDRAIKGHKYMTVFDYSKEHGGTLDSFKYYNDYYVDITPNESKSIKESATRDYVEVAYICDGFTNFRVFGGGFKTSDALVSVEDEKGKRLRLTMGDVCEFYTWHDAKGNVIHEPGYIDDANLNENYVPEYGDEFPNMNAAMYVARSLVYHFVSDPDDAEKLYAKAESDGWESSELVALCDLIGDALEASNYHSEARDYFYDKFPYWWAFDVSAEDEAKMDELIESCDDDNQRMQLLIIAVNSLVLELD